VVIVVVENLCSGYNTGIRWHNGDKTSASEFEMKCLTLLLIVGMCGTRLNSAMPFPLAFAHSDAVLVQKRGVTPPLVYPPNYDQSSCPSASTNLYNQGMQKRSRFPSLDFLSKRSVLPSLAFLPNRPSRTKRSGSCVQMASQSWNSFQRPFVNTQALKLTENYTYVFSVTADVAINTIYVWASGSDDGHYSLIGSGGDGSETATATILVQGDVEVHFEAVFNFEYSSGEVGLFKLSN